MSDYDQAVLLDALGFLVRLPPLAAEEVDEHPFRESVPADDRARRIEPPLRETDISPLVETQQPVALETVDHLGYRGGGYAKELCEARADDLAALVGEGIHGLQVFLSRG